jgi:hypothetical protein
MEWYYERETTSPEEEREIQFFSGKIECLCPGCGENHYLKFNWIGRGTPRKFCESCKLRAASFDGG